MEAKNIYEKPVEQGQDIYDLCLQEYGDIETIFVLLEDNPEIDLEGQLEVGQKLIFRVELPLEVPRHNAELQFFRNSNIRVNSGDIDSASFDDNDNIEGGIQTDKGDIIVTNLSIAILTSSSTVPVAPSAALVTASGSPITDNNGAVFLVASDTQIFTASGSGINTSQGLPLQASIVPDKVLVTASGDIIILSNGTPLKIK